AGHGGRIERTDDGGLTWKPQRVEHGAEILNSIYFIDDRQGWVAGTGGLVLRTSKGGQNWEITKTGQAQDLRSVRFGSPPKRLDCRRGWPDSIDHRWRRHMGSSCVRSTEGAAWTRHRLRRCCHRRW